MWFKKLYWIISFSLALGLPLLSFSQNKEYRYALFFKDKGGTQTAFSTQAPQAFLSDRAIGKREKFQIAIDSTDFPVHLPYVQEVLNAWPGAKRIACSKWLNALIVSSDTLIPNGFATTHVTQIRKIYEGPRIYKGETPLAGATSLPEAQLPNSNPGFFEANAQNQMIGGEYLQAHGWQGQGVLVAVLDAGFSNVNNNPAFQHLFEDGRIINTWDFVSVEPSVYEDNSHGALVLSTMAAYLPNQYIALAPAASYLLLRTENAGNETVSEEFYWVLAAEYADSAGADVLNSSLGYTTFDVSSDSYTYSMLDGKTAVSSRGALMAARKGLLVVNSAGNSGNASWKYIGAPADADSILTVAAVDINREKANFSSFGPAADQRIKPDVAAMGKGTAVVGVQGGISHANGTSFSAPILAAALAALRQKFPDLHPQTILQALRKSANAFLHPGDGLGYGIPHLGLAAFILNGNDADSAYFMVYPNPGFAKDIQLEFIAPGPGKYQIEAFDLQGKKVYDSQMQLEMRGLYIQQLNLPEGLSGTIEIRGRGPNFSRSTRWIAIQ